MLVEKCNVFENRRDFYEGYQEKRRKFHTSVGDWGSQPRDANQTFSCPNSVYIYKINSKFSQKVYINCEAK